MNFTNNRLTSLRIFKLRAYFEKLIVRWYGCISWSGGQDSQGVLGELGCQGDPGKKIGQKMGRKIGPKNWEKTLDK